MFSLIGKITGAIEGVSDFLDGITSWMRQKERDELVRKAEDAEDVETLLRNHENAQRARARRKFERVLPDGDGDPANRANWKRRD